MQRFPWGLWAVLLIPEIQATLASVQGTERGGGPSEEYVTNPAPPLVYFGVVLGIGLVVAFCSFLNTSNSEVPDSSRQRNVNNTEKKNTEEEIEHKDPSKQDVTNSAVIVIAVEVAIYTTESVSSSGNSEVQNKKMNSQPEENMKTTKQEPEHTESVSSSGNSEVQNKKMNSQPEENMKTTKQEPEHTGRSEQDVTNGGLPLIYYFGAVIAIALWMAICSSWNSSVPLTAAPTGCEFKMSKNCQSYSTHHSQPPPEAKPSPPKPNPNPSSHLSVSSSGNSEVRNRKTNSQAEKNMEKKTTEEETEHKRREEECQLVQALVGSIMARVHECNMEMFTGEAILVGSQAQHLHVRTESSSSDYDFLVPIQYNTNLILMGSLYSNVDTPKGLLPGKKSMDHRVPVYCWGDKVVVDYNKLIMRDLSERKTLDLSRTEEARKTINDLQQQLWKNGVTTSNVTQGLYNCVKALTQGNTQIRMGNFSEESAAVQLSAEVDGRAVSIDLVPIIRNKVNISMAWPQQDLRWLSDLWDREHGTEQRKPTWNITEIYKTGTDLVPKNSYWRLTFSRAETQLLKDIDADGGCRREALRVLKQINTEKWRPRYGEVLTSYHLKMVLFWASRLNPETEHWATVPDALGTLLKVLEFSLEKKHLPSYFLPSINLFDWHRTEKENSLRNLKLEVLGLEVLRLEVRLMRCTPEQYKPQGLGLFIQRERELDAFRREHQNDFEEFKNLKEGKQPDKELRVSSSPNTDTWAYV